MGLKIGRGGMGSKKGKRSIRFEIFRYGAIFTGRVFDSNTPRDIQQPIQPGDATALRDGNTLSVQAFSLGAKILSALDLGGGIFTPNGDGVNDGLNISYDLLN